MTLNNFSLIMNKLKSVQVETNQAIESLPKSSNYLQSALLQRKNLRDTCDRKLIPLFQKIQSFAHSDPMSTGQIMIQSLMSQGYSMALDLIAQEKQISAQASINTFLPLKRSAQHPMAAVVIPQTMGSLLDLFTSSTPSESYTDATTDVPAGQAAMKYFYDQAETYPGTDLPISFDEFVSTINQKNPAFFSGLGLAIRSIGLSDSDVQSAMAQMADQGQGHMPANWNIFFTAVGQAGMNPSFWDAIQFVAWQTAQTAVQDIAKSGTSILTGVQRIASLSAYAPYILLGGGALFIYMYSKSLGGGHSQAASRGISSLKSKAKEIHSNIKKEGLRGTFKKYASI